MRYIFFFLFCISSQYMAHSLDVSLFEKAIPKGSLVGDDEKLYCKAQEVYIKNRSNAPCSKTPIPKIIHQIWIGHKLPPGYLFRYQKQIKKLHPNWEYHLWSESELASLELESWDLVEKTKDFGKKADLIRCDLLDRFGGVCLDADVDLLCSLEQFHERYDFYAGLEPSREYPGTDRRLHVGVAVIGTKPGHPIIKEWKRRMRELLRDGDGCRTVATTLIHTFYPFTGAVLQEIDREENIDILFPYTYFYPISPGEKSGERYLETVAVHHWAGSWIPTMEEQIEDLYRFVQEQRKEIYVLKKRVDLLEKNNL